MKHLTILNFVCAKHGITKDALLGPARHRELVSARDDVIRMMRVRGYSMPQIGRALGNRDHTTILHHCRKMGLEPVDKLGQANEARQPASPRPA